MQYFKKKSIETNNRMSEVFKTYIYKPDKEKQKVKNYNSLIVLLIMSFGIVLMLMGFHKLGAYIALPTIVVALIMRSASMFKTQPLESELTIPLQISTEEITVNNQRFKFEDIELLKLNCFEYRNQLGRHFGSGMDEYIKSNGAMNFIWFKWKGNEYKYHFRINSEAHLNQILGIKEKIMSNAL